MKEIFSGIQYGEQSFLDMEILFEGNITTLNYDNIFINTYAKCNKFFTISLYILFCMY